MRLDIVEGEPGIFPDPMARLLRLVGRIFRRRQRAQGAGQSPADRSDPDARSEPGGRADGSG